MKIAPLLLYDLKNCRISGSTNKSINNNYNNKNDNDDGNESIY